MDTGAGAGASTSEKMDTGAGASIGENTASISPPVSHTLRCLPASRVAPRQNELIQPRLTRRLSLSLLR